MTANNRETVWAMSRRVPYESASSYRCRSKGTKCKNQCRNKRVKCIFRTDAIASFSYIKKAIPITWINIWRILQCTHSISNKFLSRSDARFWLLNFTTLKLSTIISAVCIWTSSFKIARTTILIPAQRIKNLTNFYNIPQLTGGLSFVLDKSNADRYKQLAYCLMFVPFFLVRRWYCWTYSLTLLIIPLLQFLCRLPAQL